MPTGVVSKTVMTEKKRKTAPVKNSDLQKIKKPKIASEASKSVGHVKGPVIDSEISDDSESEGGAPLGDSDSSSHADGERDSKEGNNGIHPERAKAVIANSQTSKESHAKQKQLAQERKAAKPLAEQLARTKKIWERLRRKSHVPKEERKQLVTELFDIITGSVNDFVLKHDSVRVIQTAIKYANPMQKRMIAKELAGSYRQLAESRYAKFLIGKLLVQGDDEIRDIIVPEFFGHVRRLIRHPEASWILDDVYRGVATRQQKAVILREWYGNEFALLHRNDAEKVSGDLAEILVLDSGKRAPIMRSLQELINHLIQKKMTGFTLLHDAMLQYFLNAKAGTEEITDFIELIKGDEEGDLLKNLAFTSSGSRVVALTLAYGTAKDRKHILKTYKDTLQMMASDRHGHVVILAAYDVIDDTVLTAKSIFPELFSKDEDKQIENSVFFANDLNARITLLYLLQGQSKALFPPSHASDLEILAEIETVRATTSKKDAEVRRVELVKAVSPYLLKAVSTASAELMSTSFGCHFITEVLFGAEGDKSAALSAVARSASGEPNSARQDDEEGAENSESPPHISTVPYGGKMLKGLIAGGRFDPKKKKVVPIVPALNFADILYPNIKGYIIDWATGSSSFVVLALVEADNFSGKEEVLKTLKKDKKKLQIAATEETDDQKSKNEKVAKDHGAKSKKQKVVKERLVGNRGSALLLEKLS